MDMLQLCAVLLFEYACNTYRFNAAELIVTPALGEGRNYGRYKAVKLINEGVIAVRISHV